MLRHWPRPSSPWWIAARYSFGRGPGSDVISTVPSQGILQKVNAWTASHPRSWTSFMPCGSCINHSTTGPDPLQSQQAVNASQLTEHTLCWSYLSGLWLGGTSPTNKKGSIAGGPKAITTKLHAGEFGTQMETGKSWLEPKSSKEETAPQRLRS